MKEQLDDEVQGDLYRIVNMLNEQPDQPTPTRAKGFGVTVHEYVEVRRKEGVTVTTSVARNFLNRMVDEGVLCKQVMIDGRGTTLMVYYEKESSDEG